MHSKQLKRQKMHPLPLNLGFNTVGRLMGPFIQRYAQLKFKIMGPAFQMKFMIKFFFQWYQ